MRPKAVICGSYRRDPAGLRRLFRELEATGCRILSPLSTDFEAVRSGVARLASEQAFSADELEKYHLRAITEADLIWLHAPGGYVGLSGAYELGYAAAIGKKIFCKELPADEMLAGQVAQAPSVFESLEAISFWPEHD